MKWAWTNEDRDEAIIFEAADREDALRKVMGARLDAAGADVKDPDVNDLHDCVRWFEHSDNLYPVVETDLIRYDGPWHGLNPEEL